MRKRGFALTTTPTQPGEYLPKGEAHIGFPITYTQGDA